MTFQFPGNSACVAPLPERIADLFGREIVEATFGV